MRSGNGSTPSAFVTTSWDDGHPLDVRLAALLAKYGALGTFYVPVRYDQFSVMSGDQIQAVRSMGMEIGSHTLTHPKLTRLGRTDVLQELVRSKRHFEDLIDDEIVSFCYPNGEFNGTTRSLVIEAGYKLARTTACFRIDSDFDRFRMPVSFQFFPHSRVEYTIQSIRERNVEGLRNWATLCRLESHPVRLLERLLEHILAHGGLLHIWGHSWEIEERHLWADLEDSLRCIANAREASYLTNAQTLRLVCKRRDEEGALNRPQDAWRQR
jgi:peptidoglycan-N-acetylglucosamine deacetylase